MTTYTKIDPMLPSINKRDHKNYHNLDRNSLQLNKIARKQEFERERKDGRGRMRERGLSRVNGSGRDRGRFWAESWT